MEDLAFNKALQAIWDLVGSANKYIDDNAPWSLARDPGQKGRLGTVMYNLLEGVRLIGLLVAPFMPETGRSILATLGCAEGGLMLEKNDGWGGLKAGTTVAKAAPLFPRIETN